MRTADRNPIFRCPPLRCPPLGPPFFCFAPRWLWPEHATAPRGWPCLVRDRVALASNNDWDTLLAFTEESCPPRAPSGPRQPGLLTAQDARSKLWAAHQRRLTIAWRKLHSFGLAEPGPKTTAAVQLRWLAECSSALSAGPLDTIRDAINLLQSAAVRQVIRCFRTGSAIDALGWSHEVLQQLTLASGAFMTYWFDTPAEPLVATP